jgi:hypothetical protein
MYHIISYLVLNTIALSCRKPPLDGTINHKFLAQGYFQNDTGTGFRTLLHPIILFICPQYLLWRPYKNIFSHNQCIWTGETSYTGNRPYIFSIALISSLQISLRSLYSVKGKGLPRQAEVAQRVPGRLRPRIFLTFGTTRMVGRQPYVPAAFTPRRNPWYSFLEAESTPEHMVPSVTTEKIPSDTTGNRPRGHPTSSAVP